MSSTSLADRARRHPLPLFAAIAAVAALTVAAAPYAYYRMFGQFAAYDDEGYIIRSIRSYLDGGRLYDDVFSQYGPAFFLIQQALHGALRLPLDHDVVRLTTIAFWLLTTIGAAAIVFRLTGSVVACAFAFVTVLNHLAPLVNEPGHPQALLTVLSTVLCLLALGRGASSIPRSVWCGVIVACAALTKVNVGVFLFLGFALPLALAARLPSAAAWALIVLATAAPFALFKTHLAGWAFPFALSSASSIAATALACKRRFGGTMATERSLSAFAISTAVSIAILLLPALIRGTSPAALARAIVTEPSRFASVFFLPFEMPVAAAAIGLAPVVFWLTVPAARLNGTSMRAIVAVIEAVMVYAVIPTGRWGYADHLAYLAPFAWCVIVSGKESNQRTDAFGRGVLAMCAVFLTLQAYPVAGTQLAVATVFIVIVAFVGLGDLLQALDAHVRAASARLVARAALIAAMGFLYWPAMAPGVWRESYDRGFELRLRGAERLHVNPEQVARLQWLTATVAAECTSLVTVPGQLSVNEWSGVPPPTARNVTAWLILLRPGEQRQIWDALNASPNPCVLFSPKLAGLSPEVSALQRYLSSHYRVAAAVGDDELLVPAADTRPRLTMVRLIAQRHSFGRQRSALPVSIDLLERKPESTIRVWFKTNHDGVLIGCQSSASVEGRAERALPLMYIGRSGALYAQHYAGGTAVQKSAVPVNDGRWHHATLVRTVRAQSLYVDGTLVHSLERPVVDLRLSHCQAGIGMTTDWPDAGRGWMTFTGEIDDLAVAAQAWDAQLIARDWIETLVRH